MSSQGYFFQEKDRGNGMDQVSDISCSFVNWPDQMKDTIVG